MVRAAAPTILPPDPKGAHNLSTTNPRAMRSKFDQKSGKLKIFKNYLF